MAVPLPRVHDFVYAGISIIGTNTNAINGCNFLRSLLTATISVFTTISIHAEAFFAKTSANYVVCVHTGELKVGRADTNEIICFSSDLSGGIASSCLTIVLRVGRTRIINWKEIAWNEISWDCNYLLVASELFSVWVYHGVAQRIRILKYRAKIRRWFWAFKTWQKKV